MSHVLQCVALCCTVLHVYHSCRTCCSVLQSVAVCCSVVRAFARVHLSHKNMTPATHLPHKVYLSHKSSNLVPYLSHKVYLCICNTKIWLFVKVYVSHKTMTLCHTFVKRAFVMYMYITHVAPHVLQCVAVCCSVLQTRSATQKSRAWRWDAYINISLLICVQKLRVCTKLIVFRNNLKILSIKLIV